MTFQEKSAWAMLAALGLVSVAYVNSVVANSAGLETIAAPSLAGHIGYVIALTVLAIIGHIIIAIGAPKDANAPADERDKKIVERSGRIAGEVFGFGVISGLIGYLITGSGDLLFYVAVGALVLSTLLEYLLQIVYYRGSF